MTKAGSSKGQPAPSDGSTDKSAVKIAESKDKAEKNEVQSMDTDTKEPKV